MMSPREYVNFLYKVFFKAISFEKEVEDWSKKKRLQIVLWASLYNVIFGIAIAIPISTIIGMGGVGVAFGVILGVAVGMVGARTFGVFFGVAFGVVGGVTFGMAVAVSMGLSDEVVTGVAGGLALGVALGVAFGVVGGVIGEVVGGVVGGVAFGLALGLILGLVGGVSLGTALGLASGVSFGLALGLAVGASFTVAYLVASSRFYYWPWLWSREMNQPKSSLVWDESIALPVPWLSLVLQRNARRFDISETVAFATFLIQKRPVQRRAAQRGLVLIATDVMKTMPNIHSIITIDQSLSFMPDPEEVSEGYAEGYRNLSNIAQDIKSAVADYNPSNQQLALQKVNAELISFERKNNFSRKAEALRFGRVATHWQSLLQTEIARLENEQGRPLPNPFVTGRPIQPGGEMFVGRRDIIDQIQHEVLRNGQSGAILFQGNRRTGKTSTLNNMEGILPSYIRSVNISCQDPQAHSTEDFCELLVTKVTTIFPSSKPANQIQTFAELSKFLRKLDSALQTSRTTCLICLDEYEKLGSRILSGELTGLHDSLRVWAQQLDQVVFLFAGSHAISELPDIDWTDYLIEVRTVTISFLDKAAAMKLVTQPIPGYDIGYEAENLPKDLVHRLGYQPYLIQCTMYELTEILNQDGNRRLANAQDIDKAVEKIFLTSGQYFQHLWQSELNESERETIRKFVNGESFPNDSAALRKLQRREVLRKNDGAWEFCIPVFREWLYQEGEI